MKRKNSRLPRKYEPSRSALIKVLIVEDENLIRWSLERSFRENGFQVVVADSGEEALKLIASQKFDAVITDLGLPQTDGFSVASAVKSSSPDVPVIMLTDIEERASSHEGARELIDEYMEKPFDLKEVQSLVLRLLCRNKAPGRDSGGSQRPNA